MKRIILFLLVIVTIVAIFIFGQKSDYTEDYTVTHKDLLDEYLGDWEVLNEREVEVIYKPFYGSERSFKRNKNRYMTQADKPFFVPTYTFTKWVLGYEDVNGEKKEFLMDNMIPIEESLVDGVFHNLTEQIRDKMNDGMSGIAEDPYIRYGKLNGEDKKEQFDKIKELYGDILYLNKVDINKVFEGTPIYVSIIFKYSQMEDMTEVEFNNYIDQELNKLIDDIPSLNAYILIEYEEIMERTDSRFIIQGEELETDEYASSYDYNELLIDKFPEFSVLEGSK